MKGENVFTGYPDARQQAEVEAPVSRFRPRYRALTNEEKAHHDLVKSTAEGMEALINGCGTNGRYKALALTALEESVMWAVKSLTGPVEKAE